MAFKNVGTFDLGRAASGAARGGNAAVFSLDADGIASGQAFLTSELEKRDMMVRTPLTSFTYARDIPVRVGGGWAETVSAMQVGYGIAGGSGTVSSMPEAPTGSHGAGRLFQGHI
ncbi:MAG: hypothetical protein ACLU8D_00225 [Enterocloster sp.]